MSNSIFKGLFPLENVLGVCFFFHILKFCYMKVASLCPDIFIKRQIVTRIDTLSAPHTRGDLRFCSNHMLVSYLSYCTIMAFET